MKLRSTCLIVIAVVLTTSIADAQLKRRGGMRQGPDRGPAVGDKAPNFTLKVLKISKIQQQQKLLL